MTGLGALFSGAARLGTLLPRHCEARSNEAIQIRNKRREAPVTQEDPPLEDRPVRLRHRYLRERRHQCHSTGQILTFRLNRANRLWRNDREKRAQPSTSV
jgi:aspartyl-tRNA synthetase